MYGNNAPFSYQQPRGFPPEEPPSQRSSMSRPSAKSIYMQRREYSESMNKQPDNFQYRVEHLFTCELDGHEVRSLDDCVKRLQQLDTKGRVWGQEMILEVQGGYLQLTDIETKAELESLPLGCILQTKAVLESCAYNSLLTVTVQERNRRIPQVFMFQCEEVGAETITGDLDKAVQHRGGDVEPRRDDIRSNLENIIGQQVPGSFRQPGPPPHMQPEKKKPPLDRPAQQWNNREYDSFPPPPNYTPQEDPIYSTAVYGSHFRQEEPPQPQLQYTDTERDVDIFNHVLNDVEFFMGKVVAATSNEENIKKKKKKKKEAKKNSAVNLPPWEEYVLCLQKIKYGFNLLGKLGAELSNPSAADFVHSLFSILHMLACHYPQDLPPSVLTPLLTEPALILLSQVVSPEEDLLWSSLGDCWNLPSSKWPDGNMIPPYIPEFYDGWQPPMPVPPSPASQSRSISRSNSQHIPPASQNGQLSRSNSQHYPPRGDMQRQSEEPMMNNQWGPLPPTRQNEPPLYMRVIYDFVARNHQELNVLKGDVVQIVDKSKQWWRVRNVREEEGHVPQNVLEPLDGGEPWEDPQKMNSPPPLNMMSRPGDVKAWLEYKGFSKMTVRSLGVLTGSLLLGMTKDELRTVCPEEGGRVFFQLQAIKSAIALASETGHGYYNGR